MNILSCFRPVLHERFEELYDETTEIIDEVAERMLALEMRPVGSLKAVLDLATLKELPDHDINSKDAVTLLASDFETIIADTKELMTLAEEADDIVTADILTGYLEKYQKTMWMLKAYLR